MSRTVTASRTASDLRRAIAVAEDHPGEDLASYLYYAWYARIRAVSPEHPALPPLAGRYTVTQAGYDSWTRCRVMQRGLGGAARIADPQGRGAVVVRGQYAHDQARRGLAAQTGEEVLVRTGRGTSDGAWWHTRSACFTHDDAHLRLYLAPDDGAIVAVVAALTAVLTSWTHAWAMKATALAEQLGRPDAVVVYLPQHAATRRALTPLLDAVGPHLHHATPSFTLAVAPGAALAQSPDTEESFGQHRRRLVAEALAETADPDHVRSGLARAGIDPDRPYKAAGSEWDEPWL